MFFFSRESDRLCHAVIFFRVHVFNPVLSAVCDEGQRVIGVKCGVTAGALSFCTVTPERRKEKLMGQQFLTWGLQISSLGFTANLSLGSYVLS